MASVGTSFRPMGDIFAEAAGGHHPPGWWSSFQPGVGRPAWSGLQDEDLFNYYKQNPDQQSAMLGTAGPWSSDLTQSLIRSGVDPQAVKDYMQSISPGGSAVQFGDAAPAPSFSAGAYSAPAAVTHAGLHSGLGLANADVTGGTPWDPSMDRGMPTPTEAAFYGVPSGSQTEGTQTTPPVDTGANLVRNAGTGTSNVADILRKAQGGGDAASTPPVLATPQPVGSAIPLPTSDSGYALDPSKYANPMEDFLQYWGTHDLGSQYGAAGDVLSGAAGRGIADYAAKTAAATSYLPALAAAQQQQGTAIDLGKYNQGFQQQQQIANQTIPFEQQMELAKLGLGAAGGQTDLLKTLAALQAGLATSAGTAAGTGTIGGSNAINDAISQIIKQLQGGSSLADILKRFGYG